MHSLGSELDRETDLQSIRLTVPLVATVTSSTCIRFSTFLGFLLCEASPFHGIANFKVALPFEHVIPAAVKQRGQYEGHLVSSYSILTLIRWLACTTFDIPAGGSGKVDESRRGKVEAWPRLMW